MIQKSIGSPWRQHSGLLSFRCGLLVHTDKMLHVCVPPSVRRAASTRSINVAGASCATMGTTAS
jgi:hypothetical protein